MATKPKAADVADFMLREMKKAGGYLDQQVAVDLVMKEFGEDFVYSNQSGNLAIAKPVLDAFGKKSGDGVVWLKHSKAWRDRVDGDLPGRAQDG